MANTNQYVECLRANRTTPMSQDDDVVRGRPVQPLPREVVAGAPTHTPLLVSMMGYFNVVDAEAVIKVQAFPGIPMGAEFEFLNRSAAAKLRFEPEAGTELLSIESRRHVFPNGGCVVLKYIGPNKFALIGALIL